MHIAEGFLPAPAALGWTAASGVVLAASWLVSRKRCESETDKLNMAAAGAFAFLLSSLKLPSFTGSCSHPTGLGVACVLYGAPAATVLSFLVLLFQALLLGHGGLTTLGANLMAMGIVGPWVIVGIMSLSARLKIPRRPAVFLAATLGDLATYGFTAFQLGLAFPDRAHGVLGATAGYLAIFSLTQVPLALADGWLTSLVVQRVEAGE